jgi:hypothetical protein
MAEPPPFPVARQPEPGEIADWVEFVSLSRTSAFKRGDLKSAMALEDLDSADVLEQEAWHLLEQRATIFGANWPLRLVGSRIRRRSPSPVKLPLYRFFCLLGFAPLEQEDRKLFERLVTVLIQPLTGQAALNLGHPASPGMDPSFRQRIRLYTQQSGLLAAEIKDPPLSDDKDLGLDAATWLPFEDGRGAYLHLLVQCATGPDWAEKLHDIDIDVWRGHINWGVEPVRIFAVPTVIWLPESKWIRTSQKGGLILDRPRLMELSRRVDLPADLHTAVLTRVRLLAAA